MEIKVAKSYLDMARCFRCAVISGGAEDESGYNEEFAIVSCIYIYSHMAIMAFAAEQLYDVWKKPRNKLRKKYPQFDNFKDLMESDLRDLKCALKELACLHGISPIHNAQPEIWRALNEFLRKYRNYFVHPDPENFSKIVNEIQLKQLGLGPKVATTIIEYYYSATGTPVPAWLSTPGFSIPKITIDST